jgi:hypothetical protein
VKARGSSRHARRNESALGLKDRTRGYLSKTPHGQATPAITHSASLTLRVGTSATTSSRALHDGLARIEKSRAFEIRSRVVMSTEHAERAPGSSDGCRPLGASCAFRAMPGSQEWPAGELHHGPDRDSSASPRVRTGPEEER